MAFRLPRLPAGMFPQQFQVWWQRVVEALEQAIADIVAVNETQSQILTDLAQVVSDLSDAVALLQATQRRDAISSSYTAPSAVLTASDAGSDATITIAAHTRYYGDETSLAVGGGSLTGLAYSTIFAVYYDDSTRADTTPTYVATTNLNEAQNNYVAGRHLVGTVTTPGAGGSSTSGGTSPPGSGYTPVGGGYEIP